MNKELKVDEFINKNFDVVFCHAGDDVRSVKTKMLVNNYSQIPIVDEGGKVQGCVTWKSFGRQEIISESLGTAIDYCETPVVVSESSNFLDCLDAIADNEYILVTDIAERLSGIITTYDMTVRFKNFIVPYLTTGVIEDLLRSLIDERIGAEKSASQMTFGEYIKVLRDKQNWDRLGFTKIDQDVFIHKLDCIRLLRNRIAHYNSVRINDEEQFLLKSFSDLLEQITKATASNPSGSFIEEGD